MDDLPATFCDRCGCQFHLIIHHGGKRSFECPDCGPSGGSELEYEFVDDEYNGKTFTHNSNARPTEPRQGALDLIHCLCEKFVLSEAIEGQIKTQFNQTAAKGSQSYRALACNALLSVAHQLFLEKVISVQITLTDVAVSANINPEKIHRVQDQVELLLPETIKEAARKGGVLGVGGIPLPKFKVNDPVTKEDITEKVRKIASDIIHVVQNLPCDHLNPTFAPIAAASLAYQSFFFQADLEINMPEEKEFIEIVGKKENRKIIGSASTTIKNQLMLLSDKMLEMGMLRKVPKNESKKRFIPRNLLEILKHEKEIAPMVLKEFNDKREAELANEDDSISEEEMTTEEMERLATMELGEEDLSEGEFQDLKLRPDAQEFITKRVFSAMDESEKKRASKKSKRTKQDVENQDDDPEEVDSDDDGVYEEEMFDD